jgi:hypothetical protein
MALSKNQLREMAKWQKFVQTCREHTAECNCELVDIDIEEGIVYVQRDSRMLAVGFDPWEMRIGSADVTAVFEDPEGFDLHVGTFAETKEDLEGLMRYIRTLPLNRPDRTKIHVVRQAV